MLLNHFLWGIILWFCAPYLIIHWEEKWGIIVVLIIHKKMRNFLDNPSPDSKLAIVVIWLQKLSIHNVMTCYDIFFRAIDALLSYCRTYIPLIVLITLLWGLSTNYIVWTKWEKMFHLISEQISRAEGRMWRKKKIKACGGTRTRNPNLRRVMPYPLGHAGKSKDLQLYKANADEKWNFNIYSVHCNL